MADSLRPDDSPGLLLWRATLSWQRRVTAALRPLDLTHVQFVLLVSTWWLTHRAGETPNQGRIAEHAATDPMMTSQVLRTLEGKGLVARRDDPRDSRAKIVDVTPEGEALALRAVAVVEAVDAEFFARTDVPALLRVLGDLAGPDGQRE